MIGSDQRAELVDQRLRIALAMTFAHLVQQPLKDLLALESWDACGDRLHCLVDFRLGKRDSQAL